MSKVEDVVATPRSRFLIGMGDGTYYVPVSHRELDHLIGRLMQMCDLTGDPEQRRALKDTIKSISRGWLDDEYEMDGYDRWSGPTKDAKIVTV